MQFTDMQADSPGVSGLTKHIDVHYIFVWERCVRQEVEVLKIDTAKQLADMFTKPLSAPIVHAHRLSIALLTRGELIGGVVQR